MGKISRKQLLLIVIGGTVLLLFLTTLLRVWTYYRLIKTGSVSPLTVLGYQDKLTRASNASGDGKLVPVWGKDFPSLGDAGAPIELIEFADFGCTYSKDEAGILRSLIAAYPYYFRLQFRNFPLTDLHPGADDAAKAGICAAEQDKFWAMHDKLFANQGPFIVSDLENMAVQVGLDLDDFKSCMDSDETAKKLADDIAVGQAAGIIGTPTFFVNGVKIEGAVPSDVWDKIPALFKQ